MPEDSGTSPTTEQGFCFIAGSWRWDWGEAEITVKSTKNLNRYSPLIVESILPLSKFSAIGAFKNARARGSST